MWELSVKHSVSHFLPIFECRKFLSAFHTAWGIEPTIVTFTGRRYASVLYLFLFSWIKLVLNISKLCHYNFSTNSFFFCFTLYIVYSRTCIENLVLRCSPLENRRYCLLSGGTQCHAIRNRTHNQSRLQSHPCTSK